MIVQELNQSENKIRIESAESLEDAEKNGFRAGEYSRYFINDKPCASYMLLVRFIMEETKKNKQRFIPNTESLMQQRKKMLLEQNDLMKKQLENLKKAYGNMGAPGESMLKNLEAMIDKLNESGVRIQQ